MESVLQELGLLSFLYEERRVESAVLGHVDLCFSIVQVNFNGIVGDGLAVRSGIEDVTYDFSIREGLIGDYFVDLVVGVGESH